MGVSEKLFSTFNEVEVNTTVSVKVTSPNSTIPGNSISARTIFHGVLPTRTVRFLWLYITIAVIVAFLILGLIIYLLWKFKFFQRKTINDLTNEALDIVEKEILSNGKEAKEIVENEAADSGEVE